MGSRKWEIKYKGDMKGIPRMMAEEIIRKITLEELDQIEQVIGVWERHFCEDGIVRISDAFRYSE